MRPLSPTLLKAQKSANRKPVVHITAANKLAGVINLMYQRLYTGVEANGPHALALSGDGSLIRVRIDAADNGKLYTQSIATPGEGSDFSTWVYIGLYAIQSCAVCALNNEISLFWADSTGAINTQASHDSGATWGFAEVIGYAPTADSTQMAAACLPNGDLAVFFTDGNTLYVIKRNSGEWQPRDVWDKTTGNLTGVAVIVDGTWALLVGGQDLAGNFRVWSLLYREWPLPGETTWSELKELASAPAGSGYTFSNLFLDKPDVCRCFYTERYSGNMSYDRPFWSHIIPGTGFNERRWREPTPFDTESPFGIAIAHDNTHVWLEMPSGVWRAAAAEISVDLSPDVLSLKEELAPDSGNITIELRNDHGSYSFSPAQNSELITYNSPFPLIGCQLSFSPGYRTASGLETSSGQTFALQALEYSSLPGEASLVLYAKDGWDNLANWSARFQFRWNQPDTYGVPITEASVVEIMTQVLARSGLNLEVISHSETASGFFPDFTIHPGESGQTVISRLLSFIPDMLFLEGDTVYLVNPLASDPVSYSYGVNHILLEGSYRTGPLPINRVKAGGDLVAAETFAWADIQARGEVLQVINDLNLQTQAEVLQRGAALIRRAEISSQGGFIRVPVNCGQQLLDVIAITDPRAGLSAARRRVLGISLSYLPSKAEYEHKLILGGV